MWHHWEGSSQTQLSSLVSFQLQVLLVSGTAGQLLCLPKSGFAVG